MVPEFQPGTDVRAYVLTHLAGFLLARQQSACGLPGPGKREEAGPAFWEYFYLEDPFPTELANCISDPRL